MSISIVIINLYYKYIIKSTSAFLKMGPNDKQLLNMMTYCNLRIFISQLYLIKNSWKLVHCQKLGKSQC